MTEHSRRSTDRLEQRLEFETLISDLSSRFINLSPGEVDREIEVSLERVCRYLEIDLAVLWQWSSDDVENIAPTHVYYAWDGPRPSEPMRKEQYPWSRAQVLAGRLFSVSSMDSLPEEAAVDRETCRQYGIKSVLCVPLAVGGSAPVGALGFNSLRAERDWPEPLVSRLRLVAGIFANALARKRSDHALRESEEINRATFEQAAVGVAHVGIDGRWLRANDKLCSIVGYSRDELLQQSFQDITHPDDLAADLDLVRRLLSGEIRTYAMEKRYRRRDGSIVWANLTVSLVRNGADEPRHFIAVVEDITERKRAEEATRAMDARLSAGAELAGLGFYEVNFVDGVAFADDRLGALLGLPRGEVKGLAVLEFWLEHLHPDDRERVLDLRERLHRGDVDPLITDYRFLSPTLGQKWFHHVGRVVRRDANGRALVTFGVIRDITDAKRSEEAMRELSRRLIRAHEEERALLARELHDDLTQRLAVLAIDAGRIELTSPDAPQAEAMRSIRDGLVRLSEDVHALAYQLHPSVLEELGLAEALRTECERFGRRSGVTLSIDLDAVPSGLGRDAALCLFRVAQESLNNVSRHSGARSATISLRQMDEGVLLAVRDDGVGFEIESPKRLRSLGLASMRERTKLANGTLDIESAPGQGTAVIAWVPCEGAST